MGQTPPSLQPGPHSTYREGRSAPQAAGEPSALALVGPAAQTAPPHPQCTLPLCSSLNPQPPGTPRPPPQSCTALGPHGSWHTLL